MGIERGLLTRSRTLLRGGHAGLSLLPRFVCAQVACLGQRHRAESLASQAAQGLIVSHAVARPPVVGGQIRPDTRVVGEVAITFEEKGAGLLHRHQRQQVAVIGAGRLLIKEVRNGQQRARALHSDNLALPLTGQRQHRLGATFGLIHGVEIPLEVGHQRDLAFVEGTKRLACGDHRLDKRIGERLSCRISSVTFEPVGIVQQAVAEHRLGLGISHGSWRELLGEAGGVAGDIGKMRGVPPLVEQGVEATPAAAHLRRIGQAGEIDHRRHPIPLLEEARNRAVAEAVLILPLPCQQIQRQGRPAILDAEPTETLNPIPQRPREGHVRI